MFKEETVEVDDVKIVTPIICECGKSVSKHAFITRGMYVELVCQHCYKTLITFRCSVEWGMSFWLD